MRMTAGIFAHVDAGKTTFSERVLYESRAIRSLGRVDHQDAFLDAHPLERRRGITIFSGQACIPMGEDTLYWLDTPGHADFSAEMERSMSVMDIGIVIVSAAEGVQSHTETVWQLLKSYRRPVFFFINKCDREGADADAVLNRLRERLSPDMIDLRAWQTSGQLDETLIEEIASRDEALMERFFNGDYDEEAWLTSLEEQIRDRLCFPVLSGSALQGVGVDSFMRIFLRLNRHRAEADCTGPVTARVYRVRHDKAGARICFMKLLSGMLRVKDELALPDGVQKVNELRVYHGEKYHTVEQALPGDLVAVPGLDGVKPGDTIGMAEHNTFRTEPMMAADLLWDSKQIPLWQMTRNVRMLEDEEPTLASEERDGIITLHVMGSIQLEVLKELFSERFGCEVSFGPRRVLYRETVAAPVIGIGHYEPLRHYAEVHLRLLPAPRGSGITFRSLAHVDELALNWQRLIETHVFEKQHRGVLTGSPLTDVTVELLCGRDHLKHTEGGDFRQATYRAIRNALMQAQNVLLEPVCGFEITVPTELYGTITSGLNRMQAELEPPGQANGQTTLRGQVPYALFMAWQNDFMMLTHGRGILRVWMDHYAPCRNAEEIVTASGYRPTADDTPDSVFCSHGAGFTVPWDQVAAYAHLSHEGK